MLRRKKVQEMRTCFELGKHHTVTLVLLAVSAQTALP